MEIKSKKSLTFKEELEYIKNKSIKKKFLILLSVCFCLLIAGVYLYLRPTKYEVKASVTLNEDNSMGSNLMKQFSIGSMLGGSGSVYNELQNLSSHTTMMKVVEKLGINVTYLERTAPLKKKLVYPTPKIAVEPLVNIADTLSTKLTFKIVAKGDGTAKVTGQGGGEDLGEVSGHLPLQLNTVYGDFRFYYTADSLQHEAIKETVLYKGYSMAAEELGEEVGFDIPVKLADVLQISYVGRNKQLCLDLLKTIIEEYNQRGVEEARNDARNRLKFIEDRIVSLTNEIELTQKDIKDFKEQNNYSDIYKDLEYMIEKRGILEGELIKAQSENEILTSAIAFLKSPANEYAMLPAMVSDFDENSLVTNYNELILQRMQLARSARPGNESLTQLDSQIAALRSNIIVMFERLKTNSDLTINQISSNLNATVSKIDRIPGQESLYRDIYRDQMIKERLYSFLLEQREETALTMLVAKGRGKIVNQPYISTLNEPRSGFYYIFAALVVGFFFFPTIWYLKLMLVEKDS